MSESTAAPGGAVAGRYRREGMATGGVGGRSHRGGTPLTSTFTRIERKMLVDPMGLGFIGAWLGHRCVPDPDYPEGQVTSCYYDTPDMDEYFASFDGDFDKHKVRLRWYDSIPSDGDTTAFIELKAKEGMETTKQRARLNVPASALSGEDFATALPKDELTKHLLGFGYRPPLDLRPTVIVTYYRRRFVERHSQMTLSLDSDIRAWLVGGGRWPPVRLEAAVVELKGGGIALPARLRGLGRLASVWSAFSKYGASIEALADAPGSFRP